MSVYGKAIAHLSNLFVTRRPRFFPAYTKPDGSTSRARLEIPCMINTLGFVNKDTGQRNEGNEVGFLLQAFGPAAESYARMLPLGKGFSCDVEVNSYMSAYKDKNGTQLVDGAGKPVATSKHGFVIVPGSIDPGQDPQKLVMKEIEVGLRPIAFDGKVYVSQLQAALAQGPDKLAALVAQAAQGPDLWKARIASEKSTPLIPWLKSRDSIGFYAEVCAVPGAVSTAYNLEGAVANAVGGNEPTVDGFTYAMFKAKNWTDEQLLNHAGGKYAQLVPAANRVPTPPPAVPEPPQAAHAV